MLLKIKRLLLYLSSALLLSLAWYWNLTVVIFFAFVPLLLEENAFSKINVPGRKLKVFWCAYVTFLLWNIGVTWWIVYASFGGAVLAWTINALFMSFVFLIFSNLKNRINKPWAIWLLIPLWIAWEYLHGIWDLAWIWLTIGNVFSFQHNWIQWFEYTGTSGGTLWVLSVNILIFNLIKNNEKLKLFSKPVLKIAAAIIVPVFISYMIVFIKKPLSTNKEKANVVVVQPNLDPYNEKFDITFEIQLNNLLKQIKGKITSKTNYLVLPETFLTEQIWEGNVENSYSIKFLRDSILSKYPNLVIITGADYNKAYKKGEKITATARKFADADAYYDSYNTALQIDTSPKIQIYHKSKLVPAVERMPFPALFKPLEKLALDMGGTMGSLGTQAERVNFSCGDKSRGVAPVICYESVFSDYVTEYIRKGSTFIFIITNDGWWDNTPGYVHHLNYARLRAIENRRQIARSANTGISCFMDEFGNISEATNYWEEAVIQKDIFPNKALTFFSRFGDLISYISIIISALMISFALFLRFKK
jgi:apolipoprotein N-acyltransferase